MRLAYLNGDPGIPLRGSKGSSVHVREMLHAFAPRVESLTAVCARVHPRKSRSFDGGSPLPCRTIAVGEDVVADTPLEREREGLALNDLLEKELERLAADGELDALYERYSLWSVAGARVARSRGIPWFVEVNAPLVLEAARHRSLELRSLASFLEREILVQATRIIAVSDPIRRHVVEVGVDPSRVTVVPNGTNASLFRPKSPPVERDRFTVVFVGSLRPWHGLDVLIEAFARFVADQPRARLLVVGDGPLRREVRHRLRSDLPEGSFEMPGAVRHEDVPDWLARADVAVAPYPELTDFYFSPMKIVEYCAMGLPVVASRIGQVAALLGHGRDAWLVAPGSADALAEALATLHADDALRARLGAGARELAKHRTWDSVAARVLSMFDAELATPVLSEAGGA